MGPKNHRMYELVGDLKVRNLNVVGIQLLKVTEHSIDGTLNIYIFFLIFFFMVNLRTKTVFLFLKNFKWIQVFKILFNGKYIFNFFF